MLKTEITQQVKLVSTTNAAEELLANSASAKTIATGSRLTKIVTLVGNYRSRTSALMLGLAVLVGIASFPTDYPNTVAVASESATTKNFSSSADRYIDQIRNDVARMPARSASSSSVRVAQAVTPRAYLSPFNRANIGNVQSESEVSTPIEVAPPKTKTFKPAATGQAAFNQNGAEGESKEYEDRTPATQTGTTTIGFSWPATGKLTSRYGRRWGRMHKGIDIAGPVGTPINAAADGTVIAAGWNSGGYGNLVEIRHADGTTTRYGHNSQLSVSVGQTVRQGQQLAEMGSTGHSTGSHLHFEIRPSGGAAVNPIAHLPVNS